MTTNTPRKRRGSLVRRLPGGILIVVGLLVALVGGWGDGYLTTPRGDLSTSSNAMVTREIDTTNRLPADPDPDFGELATVRIRVTSDKPDLPVFVGIGNRADVEAYLASSGYDQMVTYRESPFQVSWTRHDGTTQPAPPADQPIWVAQAQGTGAQTLAWDKTKGEWMTVVMNADGSPGVAVSADIGLRFGWLVPLGIGIAGIGLLLLVRPRVRRRQPTPPAAPTVIAPPRPLSTLNRG